MDTQINDVTSWYVNFSLQSVTIEVNLDKKKWSTKISGKYVWAPKLRPNYVRTATETWCRQCSLQLLQGFVANFSMPVANIIVEPIDDDEHETLSETPTFHLHLFLAVNYTTSHTVSQIMTHARYLLGFISTNSVKPSSHSGPSTRSNANTKP